MVKIYSDSSAIKSLVECLVEIIESRGGFIHECLELHCSEGEMRIESALPKGSHEEILYIPDSCLPSRKDFAVSLKGDVITASVLGEGVSDTHKELFFLMIELFNLSGKIAQHRKVSLWPALLQAPEAFQAFRGAKQGDEDYYQMFQNGWYDQIILESFFHSRYMEYRNAQGLIREKVIMPLVDFLNHHKDSSMIGLPVRGDFLNSGLTIVNSQPVVGSQECFFNYNNSDAFSLFTNYGYIDKDVDFLRFRPLAIETEQLGLVTVGAQIYHASSFGVPEALKDIAAYLPSVKIEESGVHVSHLLLPPVSSVDALRRVLVYLFSTISDDRLSKGELAAIVKFVEKKLLAAQSDYYFALLDLLDSEIVSGMPDTVSSSFKELVLMELEKINQYVEAIKVVPFVHDAPLALVNG